LLEPAEALPWTGVSTEPICSISGAPSTINQSEQVADVAGQPVFLCSPAHVSADKRRAGGIGKGPAGSGQEEITRHELSKRLMPSV